MLREFLLRGGGDRDVAAEHDGARGCGALIDGQHEGHDAVASREVLVAPRQRIGAKVNMTTVRSPPREEGRASGAIVTRGLISCESRAHSGIGPRRIASRARHVERGEALHRRCRHAAVDHDGLAGHEGRGVGAEIGHGAGDFVGLADPAQRRGGAAALQPLLVFPQRAAKSVLTRPGATQLTRTPFGPHSPARLRHSAKSAALEIP